MEHYLDHAATTKPSIIAVEAFSRVVRDCYGNPSSLHKKGLDAEHVITHARKQIATALGCKPEELFFTSGATESNNTALRGTAKAHGRIRKKIVASAVEHASVNATLKDLEKQGFEVVRIVPVNGVYTAEQFIEAVDETTCLLTMMMVNNENGYQLPVAEVFKAVKRNYPEVITHCDAVQGFMKVPFTAKQLQADLISISAHKIHGIKGVGGLFVKKGVRITPLLTGGHQEREIRPGTESVPLIAAFGAAAEDMSESLSERFSHAMYLREYLAKKLCSMEGVSTHLPKYQIGSPYIFSFSLQGYRSEIVLHFLEQEEVYVSSGSACSKGVGSGVPEAFGVSSADADSILRVSFSEETTTEDIDILIEGLQAAQGSLRRSK